jgi:hypothetical protein
MVEACCTGQKDGATHTTGDANAVTTAEKVASPPEATVVGDTMVTVLTWAHGRTGAT